MAKGGEAPFPPGYVTVVIYTFLLVRAIKAHLWSIGLGVGKLSEVDGKAFADPGVLRRLSSSVSYTFDEDESGLSNMEKEASTSNQETVET